MTVLSYMLFLWAFVTYFLLLKQIMHLVQESKKTNSTVRFNRFWWIPAWKVHRAEYPASPIRRNIIGLFAVTFVLMISATVCMAFELLAKGWPR